MQAGVNFPMIELQAKWIAGVLSGKVMLPSKEEMLAAVEQHYRLMEENGIPKHHTHTLPFNVCMNYKIIFLFFTIKLLQIL